MAGASSDQSLLLPHSSLFPSAGHFPSYFDAFPRAPVPHAGAGLEGWLDRGAGSPIATSSATATIVSPSAGPSSATDPGGGGGTTGGNSKKRSRVSRRAPTTVLTTDPSNFRAMVQEFTGIPAPPFSSSTSGVSRNRFDLFSGVSQPPYQLLVRPKAGHPNISTGVTSATTPRSGSDHQTLPKPYQNLLNIGNTLLPLQSLMQQQPPFSPPNFPLNNFPVLPHKSQFSTAASSGVDQPFLTMGLLDEMAAAQGHVSSTSWSPSSINIPPSLSGATPKMKYASDSVDQFHAQKDQDQTHVSSRSGEGMVDYSWVCSSD